MFPDHLVRERSIPDEHLALRGERRRPFSRHVRTSRDCVLLLLALVGLHLLAAGPDTINSHASTEQQAAWARRLWLTLTASTVMVQFFQVVALGLGSTLLAALGASNLPGWVVRWRRSWWRQPCSPWCLLRIPGIVHRYAFRPMMDASAATAGTIGGAAGFAADMAQRLQALL